MIIIPMEHLTEPLQLKHASKTFQLLSVITWAYARFLETKDNYFNEIVNDHKFLLESHKKLGEINP